MKILVVDDSATSRIIIRKELELADYEVIVARNGVDAITLAEKELPDLVTMDVSMPGLDGYETCARIVSNFDDTSSDPNLTGLPIVFITADDTMEGRIRGFNAGGTEFIRKPFIPGELRAKVNGILRPDKRYAGFSALVVDDSELVRKVIIKALEPLGLQITEAGHGGEALAFLKEASRKFDLVLTDYDMPEMDGLELCRRIRKDLGMLALPVIFLTAIEETGAMIEIFKAGANDFLVKPFTREVLLARVESQLRTRQIGKAMARQMEESSRLNRLKNDFIDITSQDLRSPLNAIIGYVDLLKTGSCNAEETVEFLDHIKASSHGLLKAVQDILTLNRLQSGEGTFKLTPTPIYGELRHILEPFQILAEGKGVTFHLENRFDGFPVIQGNQEALFGIFNNLFSNALDFSPPGATIHILLKPEGTSKINIRVSDSGQGLTPEEIRDLFKVATSLHLQRIRMPSRGAGMMIVKSLIDQLHATIEPSSTGGKGVAFDLVFPMVEEDYLL